MPFPRRDLGFILPWSGKAMNSTLTEVEARSWPCRPREARAKPAVSTPRESRWFQTGRETDFDVAAGFVCTSFTADRRKYVMNQANRPIAIHRANRALTGADENWFSIVMADSKALR